MLSGQEEEEGQSCVCTARNDYDPSSPTTANLATCREALVTGSIKTQRQYSLDARE